MDAFLARPDAVAVDAPVDAAHVDIGTDFDAPPGDDGGSGGADAAVLDRLEATRGLLASIADEVVLPTYRDLVTRAMELESATAAYAADRSDANRTRARAAWVSIMETTEMAELLQFGPGGMAVPEILGSRGLRDNIYFWPVNRCSIDTVAQRGTYSDAASVDSQPTYSRGLGAIEYLFYFNSPTHDCDPAAVVRVDDAAWAALGPDGVAQRRAETAHAYAASVLRQAQALRDAWEPSSGNFRGQFVNAGESGSIYPTAQSALNAVFWGLFYLDKSTKDMKLAVPAAISDLCPDTSCPNNLESRWGGRSGAHIAANLDAFEALFRGARNGVDGIGFDDLLRSAGAATLANDLQSAIDAAQATAASLPPVTPGNLDSELGSWIAMHRDVKAITDLLKVDFASTLTLTPPPGAGEDND